MVARPPPHGLLVGLLLSIVLAPSGSPGADDHGASTPTRYAFPDWTGSGWKDDPGIRWLPSDGPPTWTGFDLDLGSDPDVDRVVRGLLGRAQGLLAHFPRICTGSCELHEHRADLACRDGDVAACVTRGLLLQRGRDSVKQDETTAGALFRKACDAGDPTGCLQLALAHLGGRGADRSVDRAIEALDRGCRTRSVANCLALADVLRGDAWGARDPARAGAIERELCGEEGPEACRDDDLRMCFADTADALRGLCALAGPDASPEHAALCEALERCRIPGLRP